MDFDEFIQGLKENKVQTNAEVTGSYDVVRLGKALKTNKSLLKLELDVKDDKEKSQKIGIQGIEQLSEALKVNSSLVTLSLASNDIGDDGVLLICGALKVNQCLVGLNLDDNKIGPDGGKDISQLLAVNSCLSELNLKDNAIGDIGLGYFYTALSVNSTLEQLDIGNNGFTEDGAILLAEALEKNSSLTELSIAQNSLGPNGIKKVTEALKANKSLNMLRLDGNMIGDKGAKYIANLLKVNQSIEELYLNSNDIADTGTSNLAKSLKRNRTLVRLSLADNVISHNGFAAFADMIAENVSLVWISLEGNNLDDQGVRLVANALRVNRKVIDLNLSNNSFGDDGATLLSMALNYNRSLVRIKLSGMNIDEVIAGRIKVQLQGNESHRQMEFLETLNGDKKTSWNRSKLMFVGQGKVGKSSTVRSLLGQEFNQAWNSTIGADVHEYTSHKDSMSWEKVTEESTRGMSSRHATRIMQRDNTASPMAKQKKKKSGLLTPTRGRRSRKPRKSSEKPSKITTNNYGSFVGDFAINGNQESTYLRRHPSQKPVGWMPTRLSQTVDDQTPLRYSNESQTRSSPLNVHSQSGDSNNPTLPPNSYWSRQTSSTSYNPRPKLGGLVMSNLNEQHSPTSDRGSSDSSSNKNSKQRRTMMSRLGIPPLPGMNRQARRSTLSTRRGSRSSDVSQNSMRSGYSDTSSISTAAYSNNGSFSGNLMNLNVNNGFYKNADSKSSKLIVKPFEEDLLFAARRDEDTLTMSLWDFGGQAVFYSMHHIFLTKSGVYLLVFDMREILEESEEAYGYIEFWLKSIRLHAPEAPLLLVGTFRDDVDTRRRWRLVNDIVQDLTKVSASQLVRNTSDGLCFYPIDNKSKAGIPKLRSTVEAVVRQDINIAQEVSIKWILFLDAILSERKTKSYMSLNEIRHTAEAAGIHSVREREEALNLFHNRGMLFHLTSTEKLREITVIKPQWLVDNLSMVIRDGNLHMFNRRDFEEAGLGDDLRTAFKNALASRAFLSYVWKNDQIDFFVDLMKHTMLLCEWDFKSGFYLVPSLLEQKFLGDVNDWLFLQSGLQCTFDFTPTFLPSGIFQRLICLCVQYSCQQVNSKDLKKPKLFKDYASIELRPGSKIHLQEDSELSYIVVSMEDDFMPCFQLLAEMIERINSELMGTGLIWDSFLQDESTGEFIEFEEARVHGLSPWFDTSP